MTVNVNVGGDDVKQSTGSRDQHMADFDALPRSIRLYLCGMSINWNGSDVMAVYRGHGEAVTLRMLEKTERDMQEAYRLRIAA